MTVDIYTKTTTNKIYNKLNLQSKNRCKSANENTLDFQKCYHQAMADNARNMALKLRGQIGNACRGEKNPEKCVQKIESLIDYFFKKQEEHEGHVNQLEDLEESFLNISRKIICNEMKKIEDNNIAIDYILNEAPKLEILKFISEIINDSNLNKNYKKILTETLDYIQG